ncbi:hypothetical protein L2E82_44054 [Cichorium intybus]|uniref:Uncharacterized protein n=1 Tax=Cichorium intybus TaxID=13427 RepID=A0ACB8ZQK3_CICIN|nr:hypothetical protein L2E82_44054 [Cichorium intybus]
MFLFSLILPPDFPFFRLSIPFFFLLLEENEGTTLRVSAKYNVLIRSKATGKSISLSLSLFLSLSSCFLQPWIRLTGHRSII